MNSLIAKDETVTPNGLYVGVVTLASIVFTRHGSFPIRWAVPPVVLLASMKYFLPHTTQNIGEYYETKEQSYAPSFSKARREQWDRARQFWFTGMDHMQMTRERVSDTFASGLHDVEQSTGLKLSSLWHNRFASSPSSASSNELPATQEHTSSKKLV